MPAAFGSNRMSLPLLKVHPFLTAMYAAALLLVPVTLATPAVQDFTDLRAVIQEAASTIGADDNPNKGWGSGTFGGGSDQSGTAFLINNITLTILRSKWQLDTNRTYWLTPDNLSTSSDPSNTTWSPTLPMTSSIILPTALPTTTSTSSNLTIDLSAPYTDYVSSIPNLSSSLISLGRSYHTEMNAPVNQAVEALQQSMSALQSSLLQNNLIDGISVVRTVRASDSLEDSQEAWSRLLNLPGVVSGSVGSPKKARSVPAGDFRGPRTMKNSVTPRRLPPAEGKYYTHKELWGKSGLKSSLSMKRSVEQENTSINSGYQRKTTGNMRMRRTFAV